MVAIAVEVVAGTVVALVDASACIGRRIRQSFVVFIL